MEKAIWLFIVIDLLAGIALFFTLQKQDAAGKSMIMLPIILLFIAAVAGYFLLKSKHLGWGAAIAGIPAVIVVVILLFTMLSAFRKDG